MKRAPLAIILLVLAAVAAAWLLTRGNPPAATGTRLSSRPIPAELADAFSGERAYGYVRSILAFGPRPPASKGYENTLRYLESELAKLGWITLRQSFQLGTPRGPLTFTNLLARYGKERPDWTQSVPTIIGGHLDSKLADDFTFLGANDGASSTGVILEIARVLAADPKAAESIELVFFDGEEAFLPNITPTDGLYGSKYYAHTISKRHCWPAMGIVLDLVGDAAHSFFYNSETPANFATAIQKSASLHGLELRPSPGPILDDHVPLQNTGLPCLHLIGDFMNMPYWHQPGDTLEVIEPQALEKTGRSTLRFLAEVAP